MATKRKRTSRRSGNARRTTKPKPLTLKYNDGTSAWDLIAEAYRILPAREERDEWHRQTLGLEENRAAVLSLAREFGLTLERRINSRESVLLPPRKHGAPLGKWR